MSGQATAKWSRPIVVCVLLALVARVGWVAVRWWGGGFDPATWFPDEQLHWQLARNLVTDGTLVTDDGRYAARMPLYPLFLACFAWLGIYGVFVARLAQAVIGALTALVVARMGQRVAGVRGAWVAGLLAAGDPFGVYFANLLLTEVLFTLLLVVFVTQCYLLTRRDGGKRGLSWAAVWMAVGGAACIMMRPSAALLIPAAWVVVWLLSDARSRVLRRLTLGPIVLVLCMLPWGLRNQAVLGGFAWLSANGGVTLYDAQGPQADGSSDQAFLDELSRTEPGFDDLGELERDQWLQQQALAQMQRDPGRVMRLAGVKIARTWSLTPNVPVGWPVAAASAVHTLATVLLAIAGLWRSLRDRGRRRLQALIWLCVVYFTLLHALYIGSVRYRLPLMPLLALGAAPAVVMRLGDRSNAG
jgi:4-amino-4-deoxy-L-arabinose transferase-like glycosyltransferase